MFDNITLTQFLRRSADRFEDKAALRIRRGGLWQTVSYGELRNASDALARELIADGHAPGERVILYAESQPEWAIAYFGCVAAGLTVVPLDPQTPSEEVLAICAFADARLLFVSDSLRPNVGFEAHASADKTPVRGLASVRNGMTQKPDEIVDRADPDSPASVIFTAGTTVDPKGVILSHRNFLANVAGVSQLLRAYPTDEFVSVLPLNHAFEFTNGLLIPLSAGATVTYAGTLNPRKILTTARRVNATVMLGMPRLFQMCYEIVKRRSEGTDEDPAPMLLDLFGPQMRVLVSGGAALDPHVYTAFERAGMPIHEGYGLTEAAPVLTVNPFNETRCGSVGKPVPGITIRIDSPNADGIGELVARGPSIMQGYLRNPAATEKVLRDGWLYTGDLGYQDEDGFLYITGRCKDVIVTSAGKNVYPDEVELLYRGLPYVRELCVVGIRGEQGREEVHGVLSVLPDVAEDPVRKGEIHRAIQEMSARLPSYQRIQHFHFWTRELPKTRSLKVKRDDVIALLTSGPLECAGPKRPTADATAPWRPEQWERELIQEIARIASVDPKTIRPGHHFDQDLHLDSLMKVELLAMLETRLSLTLPEHIALKFQTVQDVLDYVTPHTEAWESECGDLPCQAVTLESLPTREQESHYLRKTPLESLIGAVFRWSARLVYRVGFRLDGQGLDNLPDTGPFILAANHSSHLDSGAIISLLGERARTLHVLGAKDYFFDWHLKGWIVSTCLNVLPFDRHENFVRSLGLSQRAVQMGRSILIFPEGTRSRTGKILPFKPGLGLLALELGIPVVPVYIDGTYRALPAGRFLPKLGRVRVAFGQPITMDEYRERRSKGPHYPLYREITSRVQDEVTALRDKLRAT